MNATNLEFENAIMYSKLGFFIYKREDFFKKILIPFQ